MHAHAPDDFIVRLPRSVPMAEAYEIMEDMDGVRMSLGRETQATFLHTTSEHEAVAIVLRTNGSLVHQPKQPAQTAAHLKGPRFP
ncbi:MAG: hypothetical protein JWP35_2481 [Caulobacter sp.]|nr:hypothetical protein [Caulobacter sp.]